MSTVRIQVRRGTASQWTSVNPILAAGEMGVESDTNLFKFGNGSSTWTALAYANNSDVAIGEISQDAINTALTMGAGLSKTYNDGANTITINVDSNVVALKSYVDAQVSGLANTVDTDYIPLSDRGAQGGVASLDSNSLVPSAQILEPVQDIVGAMTVGGRGLNTSYNDTTGQLTLTPALSGRGGILVEDVTNNGVGFYLSPTITAETKLTTPLVQAGTVEATTVTTGDITVSGNLTVNGTTTTVNSTTVSFDDPMIYMGDGNQSNALDLGFVAAFNNGTYQHSGLVRDASENKWVLFSGVVSEPTTTVDFSTYTKDGLVLGSLNATSAVIGSVTNSEIQHLSGVNSPIQTQINTINTNAATAADAVALKAPLNSPTFTGTVSGITKSMVGLGNVDNTTDALKPISEATQTALDAKLAISTASTTYALKASPVFTGTVDFSGATVTGISALPAQLNNAGKYLTTDGTSPSWATLNLAAYAPINNASFTGTFSAPSGTITSAMIADGTIVNADINASAAIDKTKISGTAVTLSDSATVTNAMLAGSIANSKLANSSITINGTAVALGGSTTISAGAKTFYNNTGTLPTTGMVAGDIYIQY